VINLVKMFSFQFLALLRLHLVIALLLANFNQATSAAEPLVTAEEPKLRAAIVLGILRFTNWPADAPITNTFHLCTTGNPSSEAALDKISSQRQFQNLPIVTHKLKRDSSSFSMCNALVMGVNVNGKLLEKLSDSESSYGVLTICDNCKAHNKTTMVQLVRVGNRIGFKIDLGLAETKGMQFRSALLELATEVKQD